MELYVWAAQYYQHPPGEVFQTMLPALLRQDRPAARPPRKVWRLSDAGHGLPEDALRRAPRQREIIDFLSEHGELDKTSILESEISTAALAALVSAGLVLMQEEADDGPATTALNLRPPQELSLVLNAEQQHAVDAVAGGLGGYNCYLLDGVTGSGKTEVYLQIIATVLAKGQQVEQHSQSPHIHFFADHLASVELRDLKIDARIGSYAPDATAPDAHLLDLTLWIDSKWVLIDQDGMDYVFN
jgi:primosomal protein N' (replication factor Y)